MTPDDTDPTLKLNDSTPVGAKLERYIVDLIQRRPSLRSGCLAFTHPRDVHHVSAGDFYGFILSGLLSAQRRRVMVLRPKPSNRHAHERCQPMSPSISVTSEVVVEPFRFPSVGGGFAPKPPKRLPPVTVHPDWTTMAPALFSPLTARPCT